MANAAIGYFKLYIVRARLASFKIKGAQVSLIGSNLWIIHKNLPYADPEENLSSGNIQGYQSGSYPAMRSVGLNVKVKF